MSEKGHNTRNHPMISMHNVLVTGGTFTQNIAGSDGQKASFDILKDAVAHAAFHDSVARYDPPKCHPNTRVAVVNKIMDWVRRCNDETKDRFIMWLTGAAGAGKSAIAQTFIEMSLLHDLVLASFFFGKSDGTRNHAGSLIPTLVYQIYKSVQETRTEILSIIDADPLILTRSLEHQFTQLITNPLSKVYSTGDSSDSETRRVIVIDGLDECLDRGVQQQILRILSNAVRNSKIPFLFLVASRPEYEIRVVFDSQEMQGIFARLYLDDTYKPLDDIRIFLQDSFKKIQTTHPFRTRIPAVWPTSDALETLVQKSFGQFIYASTLVLYIQSIRHQPHHRLDIAMNLRPAHGDLPFAQLDALYTMILSSLEPVKLEEVLYVLSIYSHDVFKDSLHDLCEFMSMDETELQILFCDLGSLVSVECIPDPADTTRVRRKLRILHASLHDFLLDPIRSKGYHISIDVYRPRHFANIFRYMSLYDDDDLYMESRVTATIDFFKRESPFCPSSTELVQQVIAFPFSEIFHKVLHERRSYAAIFFLFDLLPFFKQMACVDEQWTSIENRHRDALDAIFLSQMPHYYDSDPGLLIYLPITYHAGRDYLVPGIHVDSNVYKASTVRVCDYRIEFLRYIPPLDTLRLHTISLRDVGTERDLYRQSFTSFLIDPNRSGEFALGGPIYAMTTLSCILQIINLDWESEKGPTFDETYMSRQLVCKDNGVWILSLSDKGRAEFRLRPSATTTELFFLLLGYLLFFLPRSSLCDPVVQLCQEATFISGPGTALFPNRCSLLREAIQVYLARVGSEPSIP